jgi:hypothetical protein
MKGQRRQLKVYPQPGGNHPADALRGERASAFWNIIQMISL